MKKTFLSVAFCMIATLGLFAQEEVVDKAVVTGNADAAQSAGADLQKLEAAEKAWKFDGTLGLNAAATGLWNWAAGGKNNVNGIAYVKLHLLYHKNSIAWETNLDTDFGLTWIQQKEDPLQKSSDNIKLATKFGWEFAPTWYLTVLGSFQSQYALGRNYKDGYNNVISKWLAPSYTDVSVGIDWKKSYNGADFSIYLSPIAGRITTAYTGEIWNERYTKEAWVAAGNDETTWSEDIYNSIKADKTDLRSTLQQRIGTYYIDENNDKQFRDFRAEFGLSFKGGIAYTYKDFKLSTTLALFTPYAGRGRELRSWEDAATRARHREEAATTGVVYDEADHYFKYSNLNRHFGMFDVDWDVALSYQFLKCLQISLQTSLKYYPGLLITDAEGIPSERVQFRGILGLGVGYSF